MTLSVSWIISMPKSCEYINIDCAELFFSHCSLKRMVNVIFLVSKGRECSKYRAPQLLSEL